MPPARKLIDGDSQNHQNAGDQHLIDRGHANQLEAVPDNADNQRRTKLVKAGVAVGIGSAAIVAALLYASKIKKKPRT